MTLNTLGSQLRSECSAYGVPLCSSSPRFVHMALCRNIHHHYNIEGMTPLTCMFYYFLYSRFFFWCFCVRFVSPDLALPQESHEIEFKVQYSITESLTTLFCNCRPIASPALANLPAVPTLPILPSLFLHCPLLAVICQALSKTHPCQT